MARRRMFSVELIDSDRFMDLSAQTQMLYMYLCIHADDEGFVSSGRRMARLYGGVEQLDLLDELSYRLKELGVNDYDFKQYDYPSLKGE